MSNSQQANQSVANILAEMTGKGVATIIGGGDPVAAMEKVGLVEEMSHISTGDGVSLELLEIKKFSGILALDDVVLVAV